MTDVFELPAARPAGLPRPRVIDIVLNRVDGTDRSRWSWEGFAEPRHRFDPLSGDFRVRYAAASPRTALRERYPERRIPAGDAALWLVTLRGRIRVLDLTSEAVLDALGIDDRISTARLPRVRSPDRPDPFLDASGRLTDLVASWWDDVHAIRYRSRTTPTSTNVVFCGAAKLTHDAVPLAEARDVLARAVIGDGFDVPASWLA